MEENLLQVFDNKNYGKIRFLNIDGKAYAAASDITAALGYKNTSKALKDHCKHVIKHPIPTNGGTQSVNMIGAGDIARLAAKCQIDGSEEFESWIFDDIIPKVITTGSYDIIEEGIKKLEDPKEKELSLGLYSLQKAWETNPDDAALALLIRQKELELKLYVSNRKQEQLEERQDIIEKKQKTLEKNVSTVKDLIVINPSGDWQKDTNKLIGQISKKLDGDYKGVWTQIYMELTNRAHCNLTVRLNHMKNRMEAQGCAKSQIDGLNKLSVIAQDEKLKQIFIQIVREMAIQYEVGIKEVS